MTGTAVSTNAPNPSSAFRMVSVNPGGELATSRFGLAPSIPT